MPRKGFSASGAAVPSGPESAGTAGAGPSVPSSSETPAAALDRETAVGSPQEWPQRQVELGHLGPAWLLWGALACLGITAAAALGATVVLYRLAGAWGCA